MYLHFASSVISVLLLFMLFLTWDWKFLVGSSSSSYPSLLFFCFCCWFFFCFFVCLVWFGSCWFIWSLGVVLFSW